MRTREVTGSEAEAVCGFRITLKLRDFWVTNISAILKVTNIFYFSRRRKALSMKKSIGIIAALLLVFGTGSLNSEAAAGQEEEIPKATPSDVEADRIQTEEKEEAGGDGMPEMTNLQIPQKLAVVLDPWEMDRKGQIYSEQYTIQNAGNTSGILMLSFACRPGEGEDVSVMAQSEGIHDGEDKSLCIKIVFGNGEELYLSKESTEYRTRLEAGEALTIRFEGELNENASGHWKAGDVSIEGIYSWDTLEKLPAGPNIQESDAVLPDADREEKESAAVNKTPLSGSDAEAEIEEMKEINGKSDAEDNTTDN